MNTRVERKYTVSDLNKEAFNMLKDEMQGIKKRPLTEKEETRMQDLAKLLSKSVLKDMKLI